MYGAVDCDLMHRTRVSIMTLRLLYWQRLFVFRYLFPIQNMLIEYCEVGIDLISMEEWKTNLSADDTLYIYADS